MTTFALGKVMVVFSVPGYWENGIVRYYGNLTIFRGMQTLLASDLVEGSLKNLRSAST